ncbi:MAG TPA: hypothetical protein VF761_01375 [Gemmatimonadaceae bacterium]
MTASLPLDTSTYLLPTLDTASGYNACGVCECFEMLHAVDLAAWARCADRETDAYRLDATLSAALGKAHPWAVWRARDQLCAELCRFESMEGRALLRGHGAHERLERVTERVVMSFVAEHWLDENTITALRAPMAALLPLRLARRPSYRAAAVPALR